MTTQRARQAVGGDRVSAFWRVVGLVALLFLEPILATVAVVAGIAYMVVDLFSIAVGRRISGTGMVTSALAGVFYWVIDLHKWVLFGREFPGFIPSRR